MPEYYHRTNKLTSDSPELVDFVVGLVDFTLHLPDGQVNVLGEIFFEEIQACWKIEFLSTLIIIYLYCLCCHLQRILTYKQTVNKTYQRVDGH